MASNIALQISKENLSIVKISMIDDKTVDIIARDETKAPRLITVHFNRHDMIQYGYLEGPSFLLNERDGGYLPLNCIPMAIREAAVRQYLESRVK